MVINNQVLQTTVRLAKLRRKQLVTETQVRVQIGRCAQCLLRRPIAIPKERFDPPIWEEQWYHRVAAFKDLERGADFRKRLPVAPIQLL